MEPKGVSGFTLVEMLVVVAVVALLAVFAVPKAYGAMNASKQTKVAADLKRIHEALEQHYLERGTYPKKLNDLIARKYLKPGFKFKSPVSGLYYFYAVDDNSDDTEPKAYILGAPNKDAGPDFILYHGKPLPRGRQTTVRAPAWKRSTVSEFLWLYAEDDVTRDYTLRGSLAAYRTSCRAVPGTQCDTITN